MDQTVTIMESELARYSIFFSFLFLIHKVINVHDLSTHLELNMSVPKLKLGVVILKKHIRSPQKLTIWYPQANLRMQA